MNENSLETSFWVMVIVQTIGSVDVPGSGTRKMPAPRQYVAIVATWLVLSLIAGISEGAARATAAIGWALVATGMVVGPFGRRVVSLFNNIGSNFNVTSSAVVTQTAPITSAPVPGGRRTEIVGGTRS